MASDYIRLTYPRDDLASLWFTNVRPPPIPEDIPGVLIRQGEVGHDFWTEYRLPYNTWVLPEVRSVFDAIGKRPHGVLARSGVTRLGDRHPYNHQNYAAGFIAANRGVILADQMGAGKTMSALLATQCAGAERVLILGSKTLRGVWQREIEACGLGELVALEGVKNKRGALDKSARFVYCHYDIVEAWWSQLALWRPEAVICDEAHHLRNGRTKRSRGAAKATMAAGMRILLTGTPILNRISESWNLLNLACGKWSWGTPNEFRRRYCGAYFNAAFGGLQDGQPTNMDEFQKRLKTCYIRRTLDEIGLDLPAVTRQPVEVELAQADRDKHTALFDGYDPQKVFRALAYRGASDQTLKLLGKARKLTSRVKLPHTVEQIVSAVLEGESVVCFAWERKTVERIADKVLRVLERGLEPADGQGIYVVHGGVERAQRDEIVSKFQAGGGVLVATYATLSEGVTLTKARIVIMHDLDWVPAVMTQAEARVRRIGQHRPVVSKWMVARKTLDEMIANLVLHKAEVIERATGDEGPGALGAPLGSLIDESSIEAEIAAFMEAL